MSEGVNKSSRKRKGELEYEEQTLLISKQRASGRRSTETRGVTACGWVSYAFCLERGTRGRIGDAPCHPLSWSGEMSGKMKNTYSYSSKPVKTGGIPDLKPQRRRQRLKADHEQGPGCLKLNAPSTACQDFEGLCLTMADVMCGRFRLILTI